MRNFRLLTALVLLPIIICVVYLGTRPRLPNPAPGQVMAGSESSAFNLSDLAIKQIVAAERARRTDLPKAFDDCTWSVRRDRNHYVYIETAVPELPHARNLFKLNRQGIIVDAIMRDNF